MVTVVQMPNVKVTHIKQIITLLFTLRHVFTFINHEPAEIFGKDIAIWFMIALA